MKTPLLIAGLLAVPALAYADDATPAPAPAPAPAPPESEPITVQPEAAPMIDEGEEMDVAATGDVRSFSSQWMIMPRGWEATGEMSFLTSDAPPGGMRTKFTDVVVSHAQLRKSIKGRAELGVGVDLLPKQTSFTSDPVWQGANVDAKVGFKTKWAFDTAIALGPLTDGPGLWLSDGATLDRRSIVHDTLSFQYGIGASYTKVMGRAPRATIPAQASLFEVTAHGKTLFQVQDAFGLWFGGSMAFPVSHAGSLMGGTAFDPQTRVDVDVGTVYSLVDNWDVYLQAAIIDRGDLAKPETQLPILEGGADQKVVTFGITRHFGEHESEDSNVDEMAVY